jgi:hypothetical protein
LQARGDRFATVAGGGRYIVRASAFDGWFVESITLDGKDITERPFDLDGDVTSIVITYTNQPLKVSGGVKDSAGTTAAEAMVVVFPTDRQRWTDYGKSPRAVASVDVSPTGTYTFSHLVPGQYFIAAIGASERDRWRDPEVLEIVSSRAERLTIAAGDSARTLDLTLRAVR